MKKKTKWWFFGIIGLIIVAMLVCVILVIISAFNTSSAQKKLNSDTTVVESVLDSLVNYCCDRAEVSNNVVLVNLASASYSEKLNRNFKTAVLIDKTISQMQKRMKKEVISFQVMDLEKFVLGDQYREVPLLIYFR